MNRDWLTTSIIWFVVIAGFLAIHLGMCGCAKKVVIPTHVHVWECWHNLAYKCEAVLANQRLASDPYHCAKKRCAICGEWQ